MKNKTWTPLTINSYWAGINTAIGAVTPLLLPFLLAMLVPADTRNTALAQIRMAGLALAMLIQPIAGTLSDRSMHPLGKRRPFILAGALLSLLFLAVIIVSPNLPGNILLPGNTSTPAALVALVAGVVLLQMAINLALGALQGLIPDLVPANQRGFVSGIKSVLELLPIVVVVAIGPLVDAGRLWLVYAIISAIILISLLITLFGVREQPATTPPTTPLKGTLWRYAALTLVFLAVTQFAIGFMNAFGFYAITLAIQTWLKVALIGVAGLLVMLAAVITSVYLGTLSGIGSRARTQHNFIWWVITRLLFLAAIGSVQGYALYYLQDVIGVPETRAGTMVSILLAAVAVFLVPAALLGGRMADRIGRKPLLRAAGLIAASGTAVLVFASSFPVAIAGGCVIGLGTGVFYASSWALGTDLAPADEAGRYLGISNLAGAGAGIIGAGIGGPMADFLNRIQPGLGYLVIFSIYAGLFLFSALLLVKIKTQAN